MREAPLTQGYRSFLNGLRPAGSPAMKAFYAS